MIISKQESDFLDVVIDGKTIKATVIITTICVTIVRSLASHADVLRGSSRVPASSYKKA